MADGRRAEFEKVFAVGGVWARLLGEADGYLKTEFWCESRELRQYRVRDHWAWHRNFENFRGQFQSEYQQFEKWMLADGLIERQQFLGAYYVDDPRDQDNGGDDLVPSW
ncbi:MAG: hypothetical protein WB919_22725 [Candidatus Sulfotelmatobacter sp.]